MQDYIADCRLRLPAGSSRRLDEGGGEKDHEMTDKPRHPGLDGRSRDKDGEIRHKNGNTRVDTRRSVYGDGFAPDVRGDMRLDTVLNR
jgi:hypothetical protein